MNKVPSKDETHNYFIPKELSMLVKDSSGISKTVFTHVTNLQSLVNDWIRIQNKSVKLCKSISSIKLHQYHQDDYPHEVRTLINNLLEALNSLTDVVEGVKLINKQMQALSKLQPNVSPVICTWSATQMAEAVLEISNSMQQELMLKQVITENIAHCRDENLLEVYVSAWECNVYFKIHMYAYLFVEVGVMGVT